MGPRRAGAAIRLAVARENVLCATAQGDAGGQPEYVRIRKAIRSRRGHRAVGSIPSATRCARPIKSNGEGPRQCLRCCKERGCT
eukprot:16443852-Heterocapsa_arctica.AAC.1